MQVTQALQRVFHTQQWALVVEAQPAKQGFRRCVQVEHRRVLAQHLAVGSAQNGATTGGEHTAERTGDVGYHGLFDITKDFFAFTFEETANRLADSLFDDLVRVDQ